MRKVIKLQVEIMKFRVFYCCQRSKCVRSDLNSM